MNFPVDLWVSKWFLSFFVLIMPLEYLLRIFDFLVFSDVYGMVLMTLVILNQIENDILKRGFDEVAQLFNDEKEIG